MLGQPGRDSTSDQACGPLPEHPDTGSVKPTAGTGGLLEAALARQNLQVAWKRVKANKGAAGVDGLDIERTARMLQTCWPDICQALLKGRYRPSPVRKVMIPKLDGSWRELGIPTVLDRLIQQVLLQGAAASAATADRPHLQRAQPRVSSRPASAQRGQGRAGLRPVGQARGGGR